MIDANHPFYGPLWRRILIPAVCFAWAGMELVTGSATWAAISGGLGAYSAYKLFIEKRPEAGGAPSEPTPGQASDEGRE